MKTSGLSTFFEISLFWGFGVLGKDIQIGSYNITFDKRSKYIYKTC